MSQYSDVDSRTMNSADSDFFQQLSTLQSQLLESKINFQTTKNKRSSSVLRREIARMLTSERVTASVDSN